MRLDIQRAILFTREAVVLLNAAIIDPWIDYWSNSARNVIQSNVLHLQKYEWQICSPSHLIEVVLLSPSLVFYDSSLPPRSNSGSVSVNKSMHT